MLVSMTRRTPAALLLLAGSARVLAGGVFPATIDVSALDGTDGFVLRGIDAGDRSGISVASAGDVNGDGVDDLIVGANRADPGSRSDAGESYIVFGKAGIGASGAIELSGLRPANGGDGSLGFVLQGIEESDRFGVSVSSAGDVNGDGMDDLIAGANASYYSDDLFGESFVIFGAPSIGVGGAIQLTTLDGTNGFVLAGVGEFDRSGSAVSSAGDLNGDGTDDVIVGAPQADPGGRASAGESYVVFGGPDVGAGGALGLSALLPANGGDGSDGFVVNGANAGDYSGRSVSDAGDVNGDGVDDAIIGATFATRGGPAYAGESYVVFGGPGAGAGGALELSALDGTTGFALRGIGFEDYAGDSVSGAGDVNGDGLDDLIIGAPGADPGGRFGAGESYVVFGGHDVGASGSFELSALRPANGGDGILGFVLRGINAGDRSGTAVSSAGDVDGDGVDDLIVAGAADAYAGVSSTVHVVFGRAGLGAGGSVDLSSLDGTDGFTLTGIDAGDYGCVSVASAGDVNADGVDDVIIGACGFDAGAGSGAGESYVIFGRAPAPACPGDVNGDGATDVFDFADLADNFGAGPGATRNQGDLNGDGFVDIFDFADLADDFGCGTD